MKAVRAHLHTHTLSSFQSSVCAHKHTYKQSLKCEICTFINHIHKQIGDLIETVKIAYAIDTVLHALHNV